MDYNLLYQVINLMEEFQNSSNDYYKSNILDFKKWVFDQYKKHQNMSEPIWEGKESGRSPESVISTLIVHLSKYSKNYSRSLMYDSPFSSQDDFIYLISLKSFGSMTKTELIKLNIQDKPTGVQVINRLIKNNWVSQQKSVLDKRKRVLELTKDGLDTLDKYMDKIRIATNIVSGNLLYREKMELIELLTKLDFFHKRIFDKNVDIENLLEVANEDYLSFNI